MSRSRIHRGRGADLEILDQTRGVARAGLGVQDLYLGLALYARLLLVGLAERQLELGAHQGGHVPGHAQDG